MDARTFGSQLAKRAFAVPGPRAIGSGGMPPAPMAFPQTPVAPQVGQPAAPAVRPPRPASASTIPKPSPGSGPAKSPKPKSTGSGVGRGTGTIATSKAAAFIKKAFGATALPGPAGGGASAPAPAPAAPAVPAAPAAPVPKLPATGNMRQRVGRDAFPTPMNTNRNMSQATADRHWQTNYNKNYDQTLQKALMQRGGGGAPRPAPKPSPMMMPKQGSTPNEFGKLAGMAACCKPKDRSRGKRLQMK